jgi:hypothetical protein
LVVDSEDEGAPTLPAGAYKEYADDEEQEGGEDSDGSDGDEDVSEAKGSDEENYIDDEGAEDWDRVRSLMPGTSLLRGSPQYRSSDFCLCSRVHRPCDSATRVPLQDCRAGALLLSLSSLEVGQSFL